MKKLLLILAFILPPITRAQEAASIQIRVLCFERDATGIDKLSVIRPDKSTIDLKFPESFFSPKTKVPVVEGKVGFYNPANLAGPPIAIASIPAGMKSGIVMFFPVDGGKDNLAYRTSVVDASIEGIPQDGALIINLFDKEVRVVIGEHRLILKPRKSAAVARPKDRNDYNMAPVVFLAEVNGEWKTASETLVRFPEKLQQLFVSYPDAQSKRLSFRAYQIGDF